jgi:hypothetical protein
MRLHQADGWRQHGRRREAFPFTFRLTVSSGDLDAAPPAGSPWHEDGRKFVRLGGSVRDVGNDDNIPRMKGEPGSKVATDFVGTGDIEPDHARTSTPGRRRIRHSPTGT